MEDNWSLVASFIALPALSASDPKMSIYFLGDFEERWSLDLIHGTSGWGSRCMIASMSFKGMVCISSLPIMASWQSAKIYCEDGKQDSKKESKEETQGGQEGAEQGREGRRRARRTARMQARKKQSIFETTVPGALAQRSPGR